MDGDRCIRVIPRQKKPDFQQPYFNELLTYSPNISLNITKSGYIVSLSQSYHLGFQRTEIVLPLAQVFIIGK